jgi:ribulose-phosphate 3-epimerase
MVKIAPSILSADFTRLADQVKSAEQSGADMIHLDIMDGHFAPNISFGSAISKASRQSCTLPHDAHLMVTEPEDYISEFASIGVEYITFHIEIGGKRIDMGPNRWVYTVDTRPDTPRIERLIDLIKNSGCKPGLTLNPPTDIEHILPFLKQVDLILLMSVNPGFSGQSFMPEIYDRLDTVASSRKENNLDFEIMIDGGVDADNAPKLISKGADILVSGSSFFQTSDFKGFIRKLKS